MKILLLEDDTNISMGLKYALSEDGYEVVHCSCVNDFLLLPNKDFALALLDIGLPDGTGFDVAKRISCPFIFLTATDDEANTVHGFNLGADDYINKPFRLRELQARIKAVLRRGGTTDIINIRDIVIDKSSARVTQNGETVDLTTLEYKLLLTLAESKGKILTREQLLEGLWDNQGNFVESNTLTVYIKRLREKLGAGIVETVRGMGYKCG